MEGFLRYEVGGLIFGGAYTWRGLFSEFWGIPALGTVLLKSFTGALSSNSRSEICKSVIEIVWDEVFMVRNRVKNGQS